jgi:hypothetical protein
MEKDTDKDFTVWEWMVLFVLAAVAIAITERIGLSQKWEDVIVFTVVLFSVLLMTLRQLWNNPAFWRNLALVFAAHVFAVAILVPVLPTGRFGFPKLVLIVVGMLEGLLILGVLWRTAGGTPIARGKGR